MSIRLPKKRVHQLADEFGIPSKELISILETLGIRGKKPQSSLEEEEVAKLRTELEQARKPKVVLGGERIVAERVVPGDVEKGEAASKEAVIESRVQMNVIRRRTKIVDVAAAAPPPQPAVSGRLPEKPAVELEPDTHLAPEGPTEAESTFETDTGAPPFTVEDFQRTPERVEQELPVEESPEFMREPEEPVSKVPVSMENLAADENPPPTIEEVGPRPESEPTVSKEELCETAAPPEPLLEEKPLEEAPSKPSGTLSPFDAQIGPGLRVLGRIDLKQLKAEPAKVEENIALEEPAAVTNGQPASTAEQPDEVKSVKRKKRKVIKKHDLVELREQDLRHGKVPRKKRALPGKEQKKTEITVPKAIKRIIKISEGITVAEMARAMGVKAGEVIKRTMALGIMATINQLLDADVAALVAADFGYQVENVAFDVEGALETEHESGPQESMPVRRPPVVAVMGHVDHGKTSLLDAIRKTNVTAGEAGGITQHIGAYSAELDGGRVTFLDTPGHEAFTAMRARGAKVTDLVVLVTAADDGVMPQTLEAIDHARAADVSLLVCVNKIDKPGANVERIKKQLADKGVLVEDWGGQTVCVPVSAKTNEGISHLLEMILLQAEILDLRANPNKLARGTIVEAKLDKGRGAVATVLVQEGTLRVGNPFVCGVQCGRVRAMIDDKGRKVDSAGPSTPVEILGFQGVPEAGEPFVAVTDEAKARQVAQHRAERLRHAGLARTSKVSLEELYQQIREGDVKELRVILKADVQGSVEAIEEALGKLPTEEVRLRIIHGSVGGITESDVLLAAASNAVILGFNVRPQAKAAALAESEGVEVRLYTVIYDVLNDIRNALEGLLEPAYREQVLGRLEVRKIFSIGGVGTVAGCYVTEGKVSRAHPVRLLRDSVVVHEGKLSSLKRFKDDVREVAAGYECGTSLESYSDVKIGDVIESYELIPVVRRLEQAKAAPGVERR